MWTRRSVLAGAAATALAACAGRRAASGRPAAGEPAVISTWDFGRPANQEAWTILAAGGSAIDAIERGVNLVELDPTNPSVGVGGLPVMVRFSLAFAAVEAMRAGAAPDEACARSLARVEAKHYRVQACLVALRKDGAFGAAKIGEPPFSYAVKNARVDEVRRL